ncbi:MAG: hypothetical protein PHI85_04900 [Victivallaceae bacterium]|nr:hypothetical protein [Victivallaceae bacterium]
MSKWAEFGYPDIRFKDPRLVVMGAANALNERLPVNERVEISVDLLSQHVGKSICTWRQTISQIATLFSTVCNRYYWYPPTASVFQLGDRIYFDYLAAPRIMEKTLDIDFFRHIYRCCNQQFRPRLSLTINNEDMWYREVYHQDNWETAVAAIAAADWLPGSSYYPDMKTACTYIEETGENVAVYIEQHVGKQCGYLTCGLPIPGNLLFGASVYNGGSETKKYICPNGYIFGENEKTVPVHPFIGTPIKVFEFGRDRETPIPPEENPVTPWHGFSVDMVVHPENYCLIDYSRSLEYLDIDNTGNE